MIQLSRIHKTALMTGAFLILFAGGASAQQSVTATGNANATILDALAVIEEVPLDFGDIVSSAAGGSVVVTPAGVATFAPQTHLGGHTAGNFDIQGAANATVTVTPQATPITISSLAGGTPMSVSSFTTSSATVTLASNGTGTFDVGATLNVGPAQTGGNYTGTYTVTVAYQ